MNTQVSIALQHSTCMSDWALFYASKGFPIIPLYEADMNGNCTCKNVKCSSIGKHPRVKNGLKDASCDPIVIQEWWASWPNANIGLITGQASGQIVLDVDLKSGGLTSLESLESQYGCLDTLKVHTGGGGFHFYFDFPVEPPMRNKVNLLPGVDIRADGGYIVAPPSLHQSGERYKWDSIFVETKRAPDWLITLCLAPKKELTALSDASAQMKEPSLFVAQGARNSFLCSMAGSMLRYGLNQKAMLSLLHEINQLACHPVLEAQEVSNIAHSIFHYAPSAIEETWGKIVPVGLLYEHPPRMNFALIPLKLQPWISDIAKRMQIPFELICVPAIVAFGSVIGKKIKIHPKSKCNEWAVQPTLWGAVVARPGTLKSPAIAAALKPLEALVKKEHLLFEEKSKKWAIQKSIKTATIEAIKGQITRCQNHKEESDLLKKQLMDMEEDIMNNTPVCKRYKTNDATVEKLVELLTENPNGLLLVRDELSGWLATFSKAGKEGDREFWLQSWAGQGTYTVDRVGRGTTHAPSLCLSVFGAIQPDKLECLITKSIHSYDDGLLQRFQLIVCPQITEKWENHDVSADNLARENVEQLFEEVAKFQPEEQNGFVALHFSQEAQGQFDLWIANLEDGFRREERSSSPYEGHLSKYRSLVPALALIFEIMQSGCEAMVVSLKSLELSMAWMDYLIPHAQKIYQVEKYHSDRESIQSFIQKLKAKKIYDGMTIRAISRSSWEGLRTKDQIESALEFFVQNHWIKIVEIKTMGRPAQAIRLNPSLLSHLSS